MKSSLLLRAAVLAALATLGSPARAQLLFSENFDVNNAANWTVNTSATGTHPSDFVFDYSTVGIPSAPRSTGGSTSGLKLQANTAGTATFGGVSVSPTGQAFTGNYVLSFDLWLNFNGAFPAGGSGSTQAGGGGILTAGTAAQVAGVADSLHFSATGDGNSSVDYRAYAPAATSGFGDASGVFAAGTTGSPRNGSNAYYSGFGGLTAPQDQIDLFPLQTGTTGVGSQAMAWHQVDIRYENSIATFTIDGLLIATVNATTAGTLGGNNILLNYYDTNTTQSSDPNAASLLFGLYDNVTVTAVPEPETYATLAGLALVGFALYRRSRRA